MTFNRKEARLKTHNGQENNRRRETAWRDQLTGVSSDSPASASRNSLSSSSPMIFSLRSCGKAMTRESCDRRLLSCAPVSVPRTSCARISERNQAQISS